MSSIFILCTHFLDWLAKLFHTTYTSISVVFNIYAQELVLFCTAIWLFIKTIICILYTGFSVPAIWLIAFSIIQITIVRLKCHFAGWNMVSNPINTDVGSDSNVSEAKLAN